MNIIDPHIHLFDLQKGHYHWLKKENPPWWPDKEIIRQNYSIQSLQLPENLTLQGVVHVEAGFDNEHPQREIEWLESSCFSAPCIQNVVKGKTIASINLMLKGNEFDKVLKCLSIYDSVIGFRHILDENAVKLLSNSLAQRNIKAIAQSSYVFECQFSGTDTRAAELLASLLGKNPNLTIIINHAAFPDINSDEFNIWLKNMRTLSNYNNVLIKASGWEMSNRKYNQLTIDTIVKQLINIFTINNVMLASNFPLCLFSKSYSALWLAYMRIDLTPDQKQKLMYLNAKKHYQF